jgi:hypothetical protein
MIMIPQVLHRTKNTSQQCVTSEIRSSGGVVHLHGPLLHADKPTTLGRRGDLRDVDRDLSGADTNAEAVDDATDDKHGDVLRGSRDSRANDPDHSADHNGFLATKEVRDVTRAERCEPRASGH